MSIYPENMNFNAFDRTIGSRTPAAELVWESHAARLNDIITRAFEEWPQSASQRARMIATEMSKASNCLSCHISALGTETRAALNTAYSTIFEWNAQGSIEGVRENMGDWMHIYSVAIDSRGIDLQEVRHASY